MGIFHKENFYKNGKGHHILHVFTNTWETFVGKDFHQRELASSPDPPNFSMPDFHARFSCPIFTPNFLHISMKSLEGLGTGLNESSEFGKNFLLAKLQLYALHWMHIQYLFQDFCMRRANI